MSDSFELAQGDEYLTALSTSGIPVVQETASTVLGTKKVLDYISMGISFVDTVYVEEDDC